MNGKIRKKCVFILYPELCYKINGILFKVFVEMGSGHREKHLQGAVAESFRVAGLKFREQMMVVIKFGEKVVGKYFLDFVVEGKIAVELKVGEHLFKKDYEQVRYYLIESGLKLGLLARFGRHGVAVERVLNPKNIS